MAYTVSIAPGTNPIEGATQGFYTITLNGPAPIGGLTVNYGLAGTATTGVDYTLLAGSNITNLTGSSFTIAAGQTSATVLINANDDGIADPGETVQLNILAGTGYSIYNAAQPFIAASPVSVGDAPLDMAVGDFNGDGKADLVTANSLDNTVSIRLGDGLGGFGGSTSLAMGTYPMGVVVGDFNGDGNVDIATANLNSNNISVRLGNGLGGFGNVSNFFVGAAPRHLAMGDFNGDGRLDLVAVTPFNTSVSILLGNGSGGFGGPSSVFTGFNPYSVTVGDVNGDGRADLIVTSFDQNATTNTIGVLLGNGSGGFGTPTAYTVGDVPKSVVIGDFNNDGRADLAVSNNDSNSVSILLGNGVGGFGSATNITVRQSPSAMAIGDFNKDGNLDLLVSSTFINDNISILLGNGLGGFGPATTLTVGSDPASIITGDFNGDGSTDFIVASQSTDNVSVLLNNAPSAPTLTIVEPVVVNLSVSSATGSEAGTTVITVTATTAGPVSGNQTVSLEVSGLGITTGDYTLSNGTITILNGQTTGFVTFTVVDDDRFEGPETATLTLSNPSGGLILGNVTQTIAIADDDPLRVTIAAGTTPAEGSTPGTYLITLNGPAPVGGLVVGYSLGGTADPADYTLVAGSHVTNLTDSTFTIAEGQTSATLVVNAINDGIVDPNETIQLSLAAGGNYVLGNPATATLTVVDAPVVNLSVTSTTGNEAGVTVITVTATAASAVVGNQTMTLDISGLGITTGDYTLSNSTITILDGETTGLAIFTVVDDALVEGTETATLTLTNPSGGIVLGDVTQTITITDNDFPIITVASGTAPAEGSTQGTYTITLSGPAAAGGMTVNYALTGTATNPADYTLAAGSNITSLTGSTFTIAEGQTPATLLVNAINDGIADPNETVRLDILSGTGYIRTYNTAEPFRAASPVAVGTQPASVAITDFNGDGNPDIAVANSGSGVNTVSIRLGNGNGGFSGTTDVAVGTGPYAVAIGDFNGDGRADFAVANRSASSVSIRLGNGNGTFSSAADVAVGSAPQSIAIGDFNGDGRADLATANNGTGANSVSIRLGNGNGTFSGTTDVAVGASPWSVVVGDFNGDSRADFAATLSSGMVAIRLGNGNGTFSSAADVAVGGANFLRSLAMADFNGDGKTDLTVAVANLGQVAILLGNGNGTFSSAAPVATGGFVFAIATGDVNGDGKTDLAITSTSASHVAIRLGNGDGTFSGTTNVAVGATPYAVGVRDFNGDGKTDIVTANYGAGNVSVLLNSPPSATLTIADAPTVNLSVSATTGTEAGTTQITVTATASGVVAGNQTVAVGVSGTGITTGDYTLSNGGIITLLNGTTTGSITFTVVNDAIVEGSETATLTLSNPSAGITLGSTISRTITITDNDTAGVIITQSGGSTAITEGGATDSYTVALNSQPTANVTITITNGNQTSTNPTSLTFTAANWNVPQNVTVTAVNDAIAEGNHSGTITHTATSADANYNGIPLASVTVNITDNDTAGVIITQSGGSTAITEGGATDSYTVALNSQPTANVTIAITNGNQTSTNPTSLTFTAANWNVPQNVTVTAVNDAIAEGNHQGTITHSASSVDADYNVIPIASVTANITDNDTAGVIITHSGGTTAVTEGGATDSYTLVLTSQPTANVTITIANGSQTTTSVTSLTFTAANWNVAQNVTVTAVDDAITEGNHQGTITHSASSADANYNGIAIASVTANITDNDTPPITANASVALDEDTIYTFSSSNFSFADADGGNTLQSIRITQLPIAGQLFLDVNGDSLVDPGEAVTVDQDIAVAALSQLKFRPVADANGTPYTSFQFQVSDGRFLSTTPGTLTLNVTPINDASTGSVTLSGITQATYTLTADTSAVQDIDGLGSFSYQWQQSTDGHSWSNIAAATGATFRLTASQVGQQVRAQVSYTDNGGTLEVVESNPTAAIRAIPLVPNFNGDTQADIAWRHRTAGRTSLWYLDGTSLASGELLSRDAGSVWSLRAVDDFDRDGSTDLVWQNSNNGQAVIWRMDGNDLREGVALPADGMAAAQRDPNWQIVATGDFNGDDQADLLWRNRTTGDNAVWFMNGTTRTGEAMLDRLASQDWELGAVDDFTKNGEMEILWRHRVTGQNVVWYMEGTTRTGGEFIESAASAWRMAGAADFNGDGNLDIMYRHRTTASTAVWFMEGTTRTGGTLLDPVAVDWQPVI